MMPISTDRLPLLSDFLAAQMGMRLAPSRWPELTRALQCLARMRGCDAPDDLDDFADRLIQQPLTRDDIAALARQLSIGETYFFRDPNLFAALEQHILPPLIAARRAAADRRLSIWSAGCSSGEELYSLAIVLSRLLPDVREWDLHLVGSDINPAALAKARRGVYRDWSFRGLPQALRSIYFRTNGEGEYDIRPTLQQRIHFIHHNLAGDEPPPMLPATGYDLVLCRNVLMYFDDAVIEHAVRRLEASLADDGWLAVSAAESGHPAFSRYTAVFYEDTLLYRLSESTLPSRDAASKPDAFSIGYASTMPVAESPPDDTRARDHDRKDTPPRRPHPAKAQRMALRARALANRGALEPAIRWARAAVETDKCDASLRYLLALIYNEQGRVNEAIACLKHALYLDPDFALAHLCLANIYRALERPHDARRHLDIATALWRALPDAQPLVHAGGIAAGHLRGWTDRTDRTHSADRQGRTP